MQIGKSLVCGMGISDDFEKGVVYEMKCKKGVEAIGGSCKPQCSKVKLFVFGDSYVDTGNTPKDHSRSWKQPYGITYPGKPAGRFSDGLVLTDYIGALSLSLCLLTISVVL
ncbi:hypothetical protein U1Q18_015131 [Sarracenia purpurea var. burkii]